jgi:predicted cupin superfamily sugar epimerase
MIAAPSRSIAAWIASGSLAAVNRSRVACLVTPGYAHTKFELVLGRDQ